METNEPPKMPQPYIMKVYGHTEACGVQGSGFIGFRVEG